MLLQPQIIHRVELYRNSHKESTWEIRKRPVWSYYPSIRVERLSITTTSPGRMAGLARRLLMLL